MTSYFQQSCRPRPAALLKNRNALQVSLTQCFYRRADSILIVLKRESILAMASS